MGNKPVSSCPQSIASIVPFHIPPQSSFGGKVQLSDTARRSCSYPTREKKNLKLPVWSSSADDQRKCKNLGMHIILSKCRQH